MIKGLRFNTMCGEEMEKKTVLSVAPTLHFYLSADMPSEQIRKNHKEMFGFEWSLYEDRNKGK